MSIGKVIETLETEIREYKKMIDDRSLCLAGESAYEECQSRIDFDYEIIALLRTHPDAQLNEPHGDGWVSVEERLPEENLEVLIVAKGWDKTPPYYLGCLHHMKPVTSWLTGITSAESDWLIHGWSYLRSPEVTHWRPLPDPPKEA